jgi:hypothetical protein
MSEDDMIDLAKFLHEELIKEWAIQQCIIRDKERDTVLPLPSDECIEAISKYIKVSIRQ